jgi:uncharacterized protein YndB with AHSA1/START domain
MKLTSRQDIEAPLDVVYARLTDFENFERMAMRRGAEVERTDRLKKPDVGMAWRLRFTFKGKQRKMSIRFADAEPGSHLAWAFDSVPIEGTVKVELVSLSPRRTRLTMVSDIRPKTLAARLMIQSLRLAKGRVQRRLDLRTGQLANMIEEHYRASVNG